MTPNATVAVPLHEIDSTAALANKLLFMGVMSILFVLVNSAKDIIVWKPYLEEEGTCKTAPKLAAKFLKAFYLNGAILFAGMAGECFSVPGDILTSLLDDFLAFLIHSPHHIFLSEYMVNLTVSGIHVYNGLRLLGGCLNEASGFLSTLFLRKMMHLSDDEEVILLSPKGARSHFDVRRMVVEEASFFPAREDIRKYIVVVAKMFVSSLLVRVIAFSMLWATTLLTIVTEPVFSLVDRFFMLVFAVGGQMAVTTVVVAWSVAMAIVLGEKQTTSGSGDGESSFFFVYDFFYSLIVAPFVTPPLVGLKKERSKTTTLI